MPSELEAARLEANIDQAELEIATIDAKLSMLDQEIKAALSAHVSRIAAFEAQQKELPERKQKLIERLAAFKVEVEK